MAYTYKPIFAADPSNAANVAANASILIFDPSDPGKSPITITDVTGSPLPNPITVNRNGFGPAFQHPTLDRVGWFGAGFANYFTAYEGMKDEAVAARVAAEAAAANAGAAAEADLAARIAAGQFKGDPGTDGQNGANVLPTDAAIKNAITTPGTETATALSATYGKRTVDMLAEGAAADGVTDDLAKFTAARTKAGASGTVHFPAKVGAASTIYFLSGVRPDLSGTRISADPTVVLKMDASPDIKTWGLLTPVTINNTAHSSTLRKPAAVDLQAAVAMASQVRSQPLDLKAVDFTTWTPFAASGASNPFTPGTPTSTVVADKVSWGAAFTVGMEGVVITPEIGVLYEACLEFTGSGISTASWLGGIAHSADNHLQTVTLSPNQVTVEFAASATFGETVSLPITGQYGLPTVSGGAILGIRVTGLRTIEWYVNQKLVRKQTMLKDIAKIGYVVNATASQVKTVNNGVTKGGGFVPKASRNLSCSIVGDSISFSAWNAITYGDLLPIALAGIPGGGHMTVRQNLAVSGSTAQQWGTSGGSQNIMSKSFTGDDYVLVMLGTNDGQVLQTVANYVAYLNYIAAKIVADGAVPVFGVFPLWVSTGISGVTGTPGISNAGRAANLRAALTRWAAVNGHPLALVDDAIGESWKWLVDNIHPDEKGEAVIAQAFAQAIARHRAPKAV